MQVGLVFFNYHNDARSNKRKIDKHTVNIAVTLNNCVTLSRSRYKLAAVCILCAVCMQSSAWSLVIRQDLVKMNRVKCEVCRVGRYRLLNFFEILPSAMFSRVHFTE